MLDDCRAILIFWRETQVQFRLLLLVLLGVVIVAGVAGRRAWQEGRERRAAEVQSVKDRALVRKALERVRMKHRTLRVERARARHLIADLQLRVEGLAEAAAKREAMVHLLSEELARQDRQLAECERARAANDSVLDSLSDLVEHIDL